MLNDESHHIKSLSKSQLLHLLQTPMGGNEYFLHHFLLFCLRYRVIVGLCIISSLYFLTSILTKDSRWVFASFHEPFLLFLSLALFVWLAGASQYLLEWRMHAGKKWSFVRRLTTYPISILLSLIAAKVSLSLMAEYANHTIYIGSIYILVWPALIAALFLTASYLLYLWGRSIHREAKLILWRRFSNDDPDAVWRDSSGPSILDFTLPWRLWLQRRRTPAARRYAIHPRDTLDPAVRVRCGRIAILAGGMFFLGAYPFDIFPQFPTIYRHIPAWTLKALWAAIAAHGVDTALCVLLVRPGEAKPSAREFLSAHAWRATVLALLAFMFIIPWIRYIMSVCIYPFNLNFGVMGSSRYPMVFDSRFGACILALDGIAMYVLSLAWWCIGVWSALRVPRIVQRLPESLTSILGLYARFWIFGAGCGLIYLAIFKLSGYQNWLNSEIIILAYLFPLVVIAFHAFAYRLMIRALRGSEAKSL